jgi:hypothetical protein
VLTDSFGVVDAKIGADSTEGKTGRRSGRIDRLRLQRRSPAGLSLAVAMTIQQRVTESSPRLTFPL